MGRQVPLHWSQAQPVPRVSHMHWGFQGCSSARGSATSPWAALGSPGPQQAGRAGRAALCSAMPRHWLCSSTGSWHSSGQARLLMPQPPPTPGAAWHMDPRKAIPAELPCPQETMTAGTLGTLCAGTQGAHSAGTLGIHRARSLGTHHPLHCPCLHRCGRVHLGR